jgi:lauroyl/myristoyl acyltransferase
VAGLDHLDAALHRGGGAVLWRMNFCGSHIPKQALHERGFALTHVSRPEHGRPNDDLLGRKVVAPLYRKAETRHLAERVEIDPDGSLDYLRSLVLRLRANGVISLMGEFPGRAGHAAPVLGTPLCFATGAPSLARASGAALLTLHSRRLAYDHYRVVIEEPIALDGMGRSASLAAAVGEFAGRLERAIRVHPQGWMGWDRLA